MLARMSVPELPGTPAGPEEMITMVMAMGGGLAFCVVVGILTLILSRFLVICPPNEIFVFSGRSHKLADGSTVGFKVLHGGRALRIPFLETLSRMDVRLYAVEVHVANAFSRGGIPLTVQAIANVKVATDPVRVRQAVERFLGVGVQDVLQVARQTLEGVLRETLSQLTPEEVNQNRLKFAEKLSESAKDDFDRLGLELDVLKIQNVADDQQYLQSLGRAQIAAMLRDAQNAENEANQIVAEAQADARQHADVAARQAEASILQRKNGLRAEVAKLDGQIKGIENEAAIAAETARATAEQELQSLRAELAKIYLHVEQVLPAEAQARAAQAKARGAAATEAEQGKAAAEALRLLAEEWNRAGDLAKDAFVLREIDQLVRAASARVAELTIGQLEIVDGGDGDSIVAMMAAHPRTVARVLEETGNALGIDLAGLVRGTSSPRALPPPTSPSGAPAPKGTSTGFPPPPAGFGTGGAR